MCIRDRHMHRAVHQSEPMHLVPHAVPHHFVLRVDHIKDFFTHKTSRFLSAEFYGAPGSLERKTAASGGNFTTLLAAKMG